MVPGGAQDSGELPFCSLVSPHCKNYEDRVTLDCFLYALHYVPHMKQSDIFRENAENCLQLADNADNPPACRRYLRMAEAWNALAEEQDWLDGEIPPVPRNARSHA
jgi:hypothetical protein